MRRLSVVAVAVALVAGACGDGPSRFADDLLSVTRVVEVGPAAVTFVGKDVAGNVPEVGNTAEPRVLVYEVVASDARVLDTYPGGPPVPDTIRFGRDSISLRPLERIAEGASRIVILLRPFVESTRGGVEFEGLVVAVDANGRILGSDWTGEDAARLEAVAGDDPAGSLTELVQALSRRFRGEPLSERDRELLDAAGLG